MSTRKPSYATVADALSEARTYITEPGYCTRDAIVELIDRILGPIGDAMDAPKVSKSAAAPPDLDALSDAALFAYRKRTAPVEDARFFLRSQGATMHWTVQAWIEALIERNPPRTQFLRELYALQVAHWRTVPWASFTYQAERDREQVAREATADDTLWRIRSTTATDDTTGAPLYWSNADGWTTLDAADCFPAWQRLCLTLPLEGEWVVVEDEPDENPRQKGDDDSQEYADPSDERDSYEDHYAID